jgi:hypothetical protein
MRDFYHALDNELVDIHPDLPKDMAYIIINWINKEYKRYSYSYKKRMNINFQRISKKLPFYSEYNIFDNSNKPLHLISNSGSGWY